MRGYVKVLVETKDGIAQEAEGFNFVLSQSKAYLISCTHDGSATVDPINSFTIGGGAAAPATPTHTIGSNGVDLPSSMYMEYKCSEGSFFDAYRLSHDLESNGDLEPEKVDRGSPTKVTYKFSLLWEEANGLDINEIGLVTAGGKLFCHKSLPTTIRKQFFNQIHVEWTIFLAEFVEE